MLIEGWYALFVKSRSELGVAHLLKAKEYETFVPMRTVVTRGPTGADTADIPLFPNYIFCRVTSNAIGKILTTPGVIKIVGAGSVPIAVDPIEMDNLLKIDAARLSMEGSSFPVVGQRVEIRSGPLAGVQGVLTRLGNRDRLSVSVSLLQRSVTVELTRESVMPVSESGAGLLRSA